MKTAVEWLMNKYRSQNGIIAAADYHKAKEMEKQQIFESWDSGFDNGNYYGKYNENCEINCGKQYYNETFKNK